MQLELSLGIPTADDRRTRLLSRAGAGLVAAVILVLFAAADAAAADDVGSLVTDTLQAAQPIVEPLVETIEPVDPVVEPIVEAAEPVVSQLPPVLGPVPPIDPTNPIGTIDPILDGKLPVITPLLPTIDLPRTDDVPGTVRPRSAVPIDLADPASVDAAVIVASLDVDAEAGTSVFDARVAESTLLELGSPLGIPALPNGPPLDAGAALTLVAAVLIGASMAIPSGWGTTDLVARLRPIGLTLSPPVPPG